MATAKKTTTRKRRVTDSYSQITKFDSQTSGMFYGGTKPLTAEEKRMKAEQAKRRATKSK